MGAGFHGGFGNGTKGAVIEKAYRISAATYSSSEPHLADSADGIGASGAFGGGAGNGHEIRINILVRTLVEKQGYPAGTLGIIVDVFIDKKSCDVQLLDEHSHPTEVANYLFSEIEIVN